MYTHMSKLSELTLVVDRGLALHKMIRVRCAISRSLILASDAMRSLLRTRSVATAT
jgi:hypothetical protein